MLVCWCSACKYCHEICGCPGVAKKSRVLTHQEKKIVAYHEAGHAVVGWLLKTTDTLMQVTHNYIAGNTNTGNNTAYLNILNLETWNLRC